MVRGWGGGWCGEGVVRDREVGGEGVGEQVQNKGGNKGGVKEGWRMEWGGGWDQTKVSKGLGTCIPL